MKIKHHPTEWLENNFYFHKGLYAGQKLKGTLSPFQKKILRDVFDSKGSIKKNLCLYGARKISKTLTLSMCVFYLICHREAISFPVLSLNFERALIIRNQLLAQIKPHNKKDFVIRKHFIEYKPTNSRIEFLYTTLTSGLSLESEALLADEVAHYDTVGKSALETLEDSGLLSRKFLRLYASNPPSEQNHFFLERLKTYKREPDWAVHTFSAPVKDDWEQPQTWAKANPFVAEGLKNKKFSHVVDNYREKYRIAQKSRVQEMEFKKYLLGQTLNSNILEFIPSEKIRFITPDKFNFRDKNIRWACGIDCSLSRDFSSISFVGWKKESDEMYVSSHLVLPNIDGRRPAQRRLFQSWSDSGFIEIQHKKVLDFSSIFDFFQWFISETKVSVERVLFDVALSSSFLEYFKNFSQVETVKMTGRAMAEPLSIFERIGFSGGLTFLEPKNDAYLWQFENVIISKTSRNYRVMNRNTIDQSIDLPVSISLGLKALSDHPQKNYLIMSG